MSRASAPIALAAAVAAGLPAAAVAQTTGQAKNVIFMVADGAGFETYRSTGFYNGNLGSETVRGPGWVGFAQSNYPLRFGTTPIVGAAGLAQDPNVVYASNRAYDTTPRAGTLEFEGYNYHNTTYPDSANTIVSTMTGVKTYNNALNVDGNGTPLPGFAQLAASRGLRTGIVSTVQFSDATPAAMSGVSNVNRGNRGEIARAMLQAPYIDVVMGAGNPDYDNDGNLRATPIYASPTGSAGAGWISEADWNDLKDGDATGLSSGYQLIQDRADFEALASTGTVAGNNGRKVFGVVRSYEGKQQYRTPTLFANNQLNYTEKPGDVPLKTDVPTLRTMVQGAMQVLPDNGIFLGIEQGEVDRAMHSNRVGRMIEAMNEFNDSVAYIDQLLTANAGNPNLPNYANTLFVVSADHDHQLYGADSDTNPFSSVTDNGAGNLPGALFQTGTHSNLLVPIFAKGVGSDLLAGYADQVDAYTDPMGRTFGRGRYMDQTELFGVFSRALVPEPTTLAAAGLLAATGLRRRR